MSTDEPDGRKDPGSDRLAAAVAAIRKLRARVAELEGSRAEPIAVVGLGCRFPQAESGPESFWSLLSEGRDGIVRVPADRWDADAWFDPDPAAPGRTHSRVGGFLSAIDGFDTEAFGISPGEAKALDPQQRLLLEVCWEALEHAGIAPEHLSGSQTGVYAGISTADYSRLGLWSGDTTDIGAYTYTGSSFNALAGRVSYVMGLEGPAMAVDTACSSSLVAVHLAAQALRAGECDLALAGGVNVMASPEMHVFFSKVGAITSGDACKAFDSRADGYVRGEGAGVVVLKRLSDARSAGDRVLAVIAGTAVNQDGRSNGFTAPNGVSQQRVVTRALAEAGLSGTDLDVIEAHGTGTPLGDPIELQALGRVVGSRAVPALVGSVKTNLGHLEAAAGIAGLIKLVLSVERGVVPASLHFREATRAVAWDGLGLRVAAEATPWPVRDGATRRVGGVSSFGMSGTNAHVVVTSVPEEVPAGMPEPAVPVRPLVHAVSGTSGTALAAQASRHADWVRTHADDDAVLRAGGRLSATGRAGLRARGAAVGADAASLLRGLEALAGDLAGDLGGTPEAVTGTASSGGREGAVFLFPGQGSQWAGMGRTLYASEPAFRETVDVCAEALAAQSAALGPSSPWDRSLSEALFAGDEALLARTEWTQPAVFAVSMGLSRLLAGFGVRPAAVTGHSVGEYAAAVAAGCVGLEDAARLVAARGAALASCPPGAMASVRAPLDAVEAALAAYAGRVWLGASNGPRAQTVSGEAEAVAELCEGLETQGYPCRALAVSHAFHSGLTAPAADALRAAAEGVTFSPPKIGTVSNVTGDWLQAAPDGDYWARHLREAVRFGPGIARLVEAGYRRFVEVGPGRGLSGLAAGAVLEAGAEDAAPVALLPEPGTEEQVSLAKGVASLWCAGQSVDWAAWHGEHPRNLAADLPTYGFQRRRYWLEGPNLTPPGWTGRPGLWGALLAEDWTAIAAPDARAPETVPERTRVVAGRGPLADALAAALGARIVPLDEANETAADDLVIAVDPDTDPAAVLPVLARALSGPASRLWLATAGAVTAGETGGTAQAALWGWARTAGLEEPLWAGSVDLDPADMAGSAAPAAAWIAGERQEDDGVEDAVAVRGGRLLAARLTRLEIAAPAETAEALPADSGGTYLVTGGAGALGRRVTAALLAGGAGRVVATGRRPAEEVQDAFAGLDTDRIDYRQIDAGDGAAMTALVKETGTALKGVYHCAGSGVFAPARDAGPLAATLAGKLAGAQALDRATREHCPELEAFVLFGSVSGVWGSKGQAAYGAANAGLSGIAAARRAAGLPGLCVAWGPWAGGGMTGEGDAAALAALGVRSIDPGDGLALLAGLLGNGDTPHTVVAAPVDWTRFVPVYEAAGRRAVMAALRPAPEHADTPGQAPASLPALLASLPAGARGAQVLAGVRETAAAVMGFAGPAEVAPDRGLFDLGLDSLMAVELARRLSRLTGLEVPATVVFDRGTVAGIADELARMLGVGGQEDDAAPIPAAPAPSSTTGYEPIAVVGLGCRLPGGVSDPAGFHAFLMAGGDGIRPVEDARWEDARFAGDGPGRMATGLGGYLELARGVDLGLFGLSPREAERMDPQQRLLLEVSWEALERAGMAPDGVRGSRTGVYVGVSNGDYGHLLKAEGGLAGLDLHHATGNALSATAGRLSHVLGLRGPALAVDTACSSSLVAVHLAARALGLGECDLALAGGVNVVLDPSVTVAASRAGMLSPEGHCRTFDAAADGYVRGEGCGLVVLKRLADAERDGDPVLAVIAGSAVNHNGPGAGLTVPGGQAQSALIAEALQRANVTGAEIDVLEAHGTGTSLGDPIEARAAAAVLCEGRDAAHPLRLGSVKTNIGHLESAAGIAGVIKIASALTQGELPGQLGPEAPNAAVDWSAWPVRLASAPEPWRHDPARARVAGVSSFGFTGTNAHLVLREAPHRADAAAVPSAEELPGPWPVVLGARDAGALRELCARHAAWLEAHPDTPFAPWARALATGRAGLSERVGFVADSIDEARATLAALGRGEVVPGVATTPPSGAIGPVVMLFSGQGAQAAGMGRSLYERDPAFRDVIDRCSDALAQLAAELPDSPWDRPLADAILAGEDDLLARTEWTQPALYAVECALAALWAQWGIRPDAVAGHSVGEYAAAHVAGTLTLEDGLRLVARRGQLMGRLPSHGERGGGAMLAVMAGEDTVAPHLHPQAEIAAVNGPASVTLAGPADAIAATQAALDGAGIRARALTVSHAFHSAAMAPMLEAFEDAAASIPVSAPRLRWARGLDGAWVNDAPTPADWAAGVRRAVRFDRIRESLATLADATWIEAGPRPALLALLGDGDDAPATTIASLRAGADAATEMRRAAAALFAAGHAPDWSAIFDGVPRIHPDIPTYPFQRTEAWGLTGRVVETPVATGHPLLGARLALPGSREVRFAARQSAHRPGYLDDHRLYGTIVAPAASHISMAIAAAQELHADGAVTLSDLVFPKAMVLGDGDARDVHLVLAGDEAGYEMTVASAADANEAGDIHMRGRFARAAAATEVGDELGALRARLATGPGTDPYPEFRARGYTLGPAFRWIRELHGAAGEALARLAPETGEVETAPYVLHAGLIDSGFQSLCGCLAEGVAALADETAIFIPFCIEAVTFRRAPSGATWVHVVPRTGAGPDGLPASVDLRFFDEADGRCYAEIHGFQGRRIPRATLAAAVAGPSAGTDTGLRVERFAWSPVPAPEPAEVNGDVLVIDGRAADGPEVLFDALDRLRGVQSGRVLIVTRGAQPVVGGEAVRPWGALLWGLGASLVQEKPGIACLRLDLDPGEATPDAPAARVGSALASLEPGTASALAVRGGNWFSGALAPAPDALPAADKPVALLQGEPGLLDSLAMAPFVPPQPGPGEVLVEVAATGLNFRDVLTALGMYPGEAQPLGGEVAGRIAAVGPDVDGLAPGDAVVAMCFGSTGFATHVLAKAGLTVRRPAGLSPARAVTLPVAMATARHGLLDLAGLKAGETVLIHAAAGGVGMAAVALARSLGARVIGTAGNADKRALLEGMEVTTASSRELSFADAVRAATGGEGVDVVLNTLSGEFVPASFDLLKPGGRFVELGKRDVWDAARAAAYRPDVAFHAFDLVALSADDPDLVRGHMEAAMAFAAAHPEAVPPVETFPLDAVGDAFRHMAQARHIGKVATVRRLAFRPRADGAYLVTGGFGGLGLAVARRLAGVGAGMLVLAGRSAPRAPVEAEIAAIREAGARVVVHVGDVGDRAGLADLRARLAAEGAPPLRSIFHAAGHLDDGLLDEQPRAAVAGVLHPKTEGALALAEVFADAPLDAFVLFSSAVATLGAPGQTAYAAANAFLDAVAGDLRARGIPATAIAWGPWAGAGMTSGLGDADIARMARRGMRPLTVEEGLDLLMGLAGGDQARVIAAARAATPGPIAAPAVSAQADAQPPLFSPADLEEHVLRAVRTVMGLGEAQPLKRRRPFKELGFDSLMAVELRTSLSRLTGVTLPATLVFDYPTIDELIAHLREEIAPRTEEGSPQDPAEGAAGDDTADGDDMDEDALAALLDAKLNGILGGSGE